MLDAFFPDDRAASAYVIPYEQLYADGYRGLIFDIDNTLVMHGKPADRRSMELFSRLSAVGFRCCLLSNNNEARVRMFNDDIHAFYICHAHKPSPEGYGRAMAAMSTDRGNTIFIGDQLFTDILGAKRAGIRNILVNPIDPREKIQIVLKRPLEKIVLHFYEKKNNKVRAKEM